MQSCFSFNFNFNFNCSFLFALLIQFLFVCLILCSAWKVNLLKLYWKEKKKKGAKTHSNLAWFDLIWQSISNREMRYLPNVKEIIWDLATESIINNKSSEEKWNWAHVECASAVFIYFDILRDEIITSALLYNGDSIENDRIQCMFGHHRKCARAIIVT